MLWYLEGNSGGGCAVTPTDLQQLMLKIKQELEQSDDLTEQSAVRMIEEGIRQVQAKANQTQ